jgi:hypothetical protein
MDQCGRGGVKACATARQWKNSTGSSIIRKEKTALNSHTALFDCFYIEIHFVAIWGEIQIDLRTPEELNKLLAV